MRVPKHMHDNTRLTPPCISDRASGMHDEPLVLTLPSLHPFHIQDPVHPSTITSGHHANLIPFLIFLPSFRVSDKARLRRSFHKNTLRSSLVVSFVMSFY